MKRTPRNDPSTISAVDFQYASSGVNEGQAPAMTNAGMVKTAPAAISRSQRAPSENYAEWLALDQRIASGEAVSEADARWHRSYPQSAQYRAESKRKAAA